MPRAALAAMITRMDRDVGRILHRLVEHGIDDNTVVLFNSDNGPAMEGGADPDFFLMQGDVNGILGIPPGEHEPATEPNVAAALFEETAESKARRTVIAAEMKSLPQPRFKGRPTKKTRRDYEKWLRSSDDE